MSEQKTKPTNASVKALLEAVEPERRHRQLEGTRAAASISGI